MEVDINYEILKSLNGEDLIKEVSVAVKNALDTFHFASSYKMVANGDVENGINWADGYIPYDEIYRLLNELVDGYTHPLAYGRDNCSFLSGLLGRNIINLLKYGCRLPVKRRPIFQIFVTCYKCRNVHCVTTHAYAFYECLVYNFQCKLMARCPDDKTRHTAMFVSAV
jgi:hypothetical protein